MHMTAPQDVKVALVDDHKMFRSGMVEVINGFTGYTVVWEADNGRECTEKILSEPLPDIVLLDIAMPIMDGFETAKWIEQRYPNIKILALSMFADEDKIMRMLESGVDGYILKNADVKELKKALQSLQEEGYYYANQVAEILVKNMNKKKEVRVELSGREIEFLKLACTELPYKSFAPVMCERNYPVNARVIEDIREKLFKKLQVSSRMGLMRYAIKHGICKIE
jgi:DNA-binding NarL/FixJ family response regulator